MVTKRRRPEETTTIESSLPKSCLSSRNLCRTVAIIVTASLSRPTTAFVVVHHGPRRYSSFQRIPPSSAASLGSSFSLDGPLVVVASPSSVEQRDEEFPIEQLSIESPSHPLRGSWDNVHTKPPVALSEQPQVIQDTSTVATTSTSPPCLKQGPHSTSSSSATNTFRRWKRRLVTKEDRKHMHKITGISFLLASWGLMGYGIKDLLAHGWTQPVTSHGQPFLCLLHVLMWSSVFQSFTSFSMACKYRRNQPAVRNTFLCNAAVAILGSVSALWSSPWYPTALNGLPSMAFYLVMDAIGLIGMGDNLFRLRELIASRQTTSSRKKDIIDKTISVGGGGSTSFWMDVFVYMMPILIGAPFFLAIGWQFGIRHDRTFYLNLIQQTQRFPHLEAGAVYGMVMVAIGASYSSLFVTLRDKKLIGKRTEGLSLTAVMLCLIGSLYQALRDPGTIAALVGM